MSKTKQRRRRRRDHVGEIEAIHADGAVGCQRIAEVVGTNGLLHDRVLAVLNQR